MISVSFWLTVWQVAYLLQVHIMIEM